MDSPWIFLGLIFFAVFLLVQGMVVPVFGESSRMRKRLLSRLSTAVAASGTHRTSPRCCARRPCQKGSRRSSARWKTCRGWPGSRVSSSKADGARPCAPRGSPLRRTCSGGRDSCAPASFTRDPLWAALGALGALCLPCIKIPRDCMQGDWRKSTNRCSRPRRRSSGHRRRGIPSCGDPETRGRGAWRSPSRASLISSSPRSITAVTCGARCSECSSAFLRFP